MFYAELYELSDALHWANMVTNNICSEVAT